MSDLFSCPQCHRVILPGDQFCAGCGFLLQSTATPEAKQANASFWTHSPVPQLQEYLLQHRLITTIAAGGICLLLLLSIWRPWTALNTTRVSYSNEPTPTASAQVSSQADLQAVSAALDLASEATPSPAPRWKIAEALVNIRATPSLQGEVRLRVKAGAEFTGTGQTQSAEGHQWIELQLEGSERGWVSAQLLKAVAIASAAPTEKLASTAPSSVPTVQASASRRPAARMLNHEKLSGWMQGTSVDRQRTALAMTRLMFPQDPSETLNKKAILLETCITGSGEDTKIKNHEVAEIAAICALLLGWQESDKTSAAKN
jgi:uncharacterized protein YgiM (DUF1202 family)